MAQIHILEICQKPNINQSCHVSGSKRPEREWRNTAYIMAFSLKKLLTCNYTVNKVNVLDSAESNDSWVYTGQHPQWILEFSQQVAYTYYLVLRGKLTWSICSMTVPKTTIITAILTEIEGGRKPHSYIGYRHSWPATRTILLKKPLMVVALDGDVKWPELITNKLINFLSKSYV